MILFHGTQIPAGSVADKVMKAPSFNHPFFVTDSKDVASSYARKGSLFIFTSTQDFEKKTFDIQNMSMRKKLGEKIGENLRALMMENANGIKSLYALSYEIAGTLLNLRDFHSNKLKITIQSMQTPQFKALKEIGFIEKIGVGKWRLNSSIENFWKNHDMLKIRRAFKAVLYEKIYGMGYLTVKDIDTSTIKQKNAFEYAILDMRALDKVWPVSIGQDDIDSISTAIEDLT